MYFFCRSITRFGILTVLLFVIGCAGVGSEKAITDRSKTLQIVKRLGLDIKKQQAFQSNVEIMKTLAACPQTAVEMLVGELKPVAIIKLDYATNNPIENAEARHVMWCLRALYYLTNHKMLASSSYKLTDSELDINRSGLIVKEDGKWSFFAEWMSRGTVYFAPVDAQEQIIEQWKEWMNQKAAAYSYPKAVTFDEWYFGGPE